MTCALTLNPLRDNKPEKGQENATCWFVPSDESSSKINTFFISQRKIKDVFLTFFCVQFLLSATTVMTNYCVFAENMSILWASFEILSH